MSLGAWLRRKVEDLLPWYDQIEARQHAEREKAQDDRVEAEVTRAARLERRIRLAAASDDITRSLRERHR